MPGAEGRVQLGLLFSLLLVCSSPDSHSQDTKAKPFLGRMTGSSANIRPTMLTGLQEVCEPVFGGAERFTW